MCAATNKAGPWLSDMVSIKNAAWTSEENRHNFFSPLLGKVLLFTRCHIIDHGWMNRAKDKEALKRKWETVSWTFHCSPFVLNDLEFCTNKQKD